MPQNIERLLELCGQESLLQADGFEAAILGALVASPGRPALLVYDLELCVKILVERDGMTREDAEEYLDFNTVGAWVGDFTPAFLVRSDG